MGDVQAIMVADPDIVQASLVSPQVVSRDALLERWSFPFGCSVECGNKSIGQISDLTIQVRTRKLTHLIVRQGVVRRYSRAVPSSLVASSDGERVVIGLTQAALNDETSLVGQKPVRDLTAGTANLRADTRVAIGNQALGTVAGVLADPTTWIVSAILIRRGAFQAGCPIVPMDRVVRLGQDRLILDAGLEALSTFPEYRPDGDIKFDVIQAIRDDEFLRRLSADYLNVTVRQGVVTVSGNIRTSAHRPRIDAAVRHVKGALALRNRPYGDDELEIAVAQALGDDFRTRDYFVPVQANHGCIRLEGNVPNIALSLAREVPGVRAVAAGSR